MVPARGLTPRPGMTLLGKPLDLFRLPPSEPQAWDALSRYYSRSSPALYEHKNKLVADLLPNTESTASAGSNATTILPQLLGARRR